MSIVMWFVKDFADGWIAFDNEEEARHEVAQTGAIMLVGYRPKESTMIKPEIEQAFLDMVESHGADRVGLGMKQLTTRRAYAETTVLVKQTERLLEALIEAGFGELTLTELYNEIAGEAHRR